MADEKKIANEMLTDEELDGVAGGMYNETAGDRRFLNDLAGLAGGYSTRRPFFEDNEKISREVTAAWSKIGIGVETNLFTANKYFKDGVEIPRREAFKIACGKYNKNLQDMPGDYNL